MFQCKFKSCFGSTVNVERCLCLIMLTDYISCAIANSSFYSSFNVKYSEKFLTQLFNRLNREWVFIYSAKHACKYIFRMFHRFKLNLNIDSGCDDCYSSNIKLPIEVKYTNYIFQLLQVYILYNYSTTKNLLYL